MNDLLGELLPVAVGIGLSPVPVIATILMLLAPQASRTSVAFLAGWVVGISLLTCLAALLAGVVEPDAERGPSPVGGWIKLLLGVALLVLAWRQWRTT